MPNEWERMLISLALRLGDGGLVTKNVCAYFQNDTMTVHQPPFVEFPQADDGGFCLWRMLKAGNLDIFSAHWDSAFSQTKTEQLR